MSSEIENLLWYLQDAANSICGQQGATSHQEKLLELHALLTTAPPSSATPGDGFVLTMRSGVSSMNDNVIGTFRDYATALTVGGMLYEADKLDHPEYRTFDVKPQERAGSDAGVVVSDVIWRIDNEAAQFVDEKGMVYLHYLRDRLATRPQPASDASGVAPCQFAVFDEFGNSADDRVWDYAKQQAAQQQEGSDAGAVRCGNERYELDAYIWRRESTQEWVFEISGAINGTAFISRHVEPLTTPPEDVAGLPSLYDTHPQPASDESLENDARYRWLRECDLEQEQHVRTGCDCCRCELLSGDDLDAAIDEQRASDEKDDG